MKVKRIKNKNFHFTFLFRTSFFIHPKQQVPFESLKRQKANKKKKKEKIKKAKQIIKNVQIKIKTNLYLYYNLVLLKKDDLCAEFFYELKILNEFCIPQ